MKKFNLRRVLENAKFALRMVGFMLSFILAVVVFVSTTLFYLAAVITSPIWYSFLIWVAPYDAAELIIHCDEGDDGWIGTFVASPCYAAKLLFFNLPMGLIWVPVWMHLLSKKMRVRFLEADCDMNVELKNLSIERQLEFYKGTAYKGHAICRMSQKAREMLWKEGDLEDMKNVLKSSMITVEQISSVLSHGSTEQQKLLEEYFSLSGERPKEVLSYLIEDLSEQEHKLLSAYLMRNSITDEELLDQLMTEVIQDQKYEAGLAFDLMKQIVRRQGLSEKLVKRFWEAFPETSITRGIRKQMQKQMGLHVRELLLKQITDEAEWRTFCHSNNIPEEIQPMMSEKQFEIFIEEKGLFSKKAAEEMLLHTITETQQEYFRKVLEVVDDVSDECLFLIMTTPWKRKVAIAVGLDMLKNQE